jgi:hypothetical protein
VLFTLLSNGKAGNQTSLHRRESRWKIRDIQAKRSRSAGILAGVRGEAAYTLQYCLFWTSRFSVWS